MPGNNFISGLSKSTMVVYVTTFCTVVAFRRTAETFPLNESLGNASTLNVHVLSGMDRAHVAFIGAHVNLHLGQVLRDGEERRRLQASSHRLAHINAAGNHRAVNGRADGGVLQVRLRHRYRSSLLLRLRAGLRYLRFGCSHGCVSAL